MDQVPEIKGLDLKHPLWKTAFLVMESEKKPFLSVGGCKPQAGMVPAGQDRAGS